MLVTMILLGIAVWFATELVVDSRFFEPMRDWLESRYKEVRTKELRAYYDDDMAAAAKDLLIYHKTGPALTWKSGTLKWLTLLVSCKMCAGTWIGLLVALFVAPIVSVPLVGWVLTGLTLKGIAHLILIGQNAVLTWQAKVETPPMTPSQASSYEELNEKLRGMHVPTVH